LKFQTPPKATSHVKFQRSFQHQFLRTGLRAFGDSADNQPR
jgi:hypothetical protein